MESIYDELGGDKVFDAVIAKFYERALADPLLELYFVDVDMTSKMNSFKNYLGMLLGGTEKYQGRTIFDAHKGREITDLGFDTFVGMFVDTLRNMNCREDVIAQVTEKLAPLKNEVVDSFKWPGKHYYAPSQPTKR